MFIVVVIVVIVDFICPGLIVNKILKMNDCSSQFLTHQAAVCSGNYPAYFGEGTKLTVLGKITAITINT